MKVGVIPPLANSRVSGRPVSYQDVRRWACTAEELGFDSVWIYDHLLVRRPDQPQLGVWEGWSILAALADATKRVELGTGVTCVGFRNPALLAKMAITVDEVSGGRLILGLGAGNQRPEFEAFGYDFDRRVAAFEEAIQIIAPLIREGAVDFRGTYHSAIECELDPRGPRPSGPPILIGANGPRMMRLAARYADLWTCAYPGGAQGLTQARDRLAAACEAEGREASTLDLTVGEWIDYPDGSSPGTGLQTFVRGSEEAIVDLLTGYDQLGVDHVMLQAGPDNYDEVLGRFGRALGAYRGSSPAG
jgi:probable F420-dependent oxidoreductase